VTLHALYLDTSLWTQLLQMEVSSFKHPTFWIAAVRIVLINLLLSGDNALVIAMACRGLPRRQRIWGIAIGAGVAVFLLIALTAVVTWLIALPYLKIAGGLALFYRSQVASARTIERKWSGHHCGFVAGSAHRRYRRPHHELR
jgi:predicted tellurium resistance membrane protein TerC